MEKHEEIIQKLVKDPKFSEIREAILDLVRTITHRNIESLISGKQTSNGAKQQLSRIRKLMKAQGIPIMRSNRDFYNKIIQPAYMKMIQSGG